MTTPILGIRRFPGVRDIFNPRHGCLLAPWGILWRGPLYRGRGMYLLGQRFSACFVLKFAPQTRQWEKMRKCKLDITVCVNNPSVCQTFSAANRQFCSFLLSAGEIMRSADDSPFLLELETHFGRGRHLGGFILNAMCMLRARKCCSTSSHSLPARTGI